MNIRVEIAAISLEQNVNPDYRIVLLGTCLCFFSIDNIALSASWILALAEELQLAASLIEKDGSDNNCTGFLLILPLSASVMLQVTLINQ